MTQGIYVITDEDLFPGRSHVEIARAALAGGASVIQLRDKNAPDEHLIRAGLEIARLSAEYDALFVVNDRLDVALACGAGGLHVGQTDIPARELRSLIGDMVLGVSVANQEQAERARKDGAGYVGFGPVYSTVTKADAGEALGIAGIALIKEAAALPVVAIGGIGLSNIREVVRAGADSAAVISAVVCAPDMEEAVRDLVKAWETAENALRRP